MQLSIVLAISGFTAVSAGAIARGCCKFTEKWTALAATHTACHTSSAGAKDALFSCPDAVKVQYVHFDDTPTVNSDITTIDVPGNTVAQKDVYVGLTCDGVDSVGMYCPKSEMYYGTSQDFYRIFNAGGAVNCHGPATVVSFTPHTAGLKC